VGDKAIHKELGDIMERAATTASSLEAEQDSGSGPRCQDTILGDVDVQTRLELILLGINLILHSIKLVLLVISFYYWAELSTVRPQVSTARPNLVLLEETATMPYDLPLPGGHTPRSDEGRLKHDELVTKLSDRVVAMEEDLKQTKKTYSTAFTKLVLKVKKLEKQVRSGKARRRARIEDVETQEKNSADTEVILEEETPTELIKDLGSGEKGEKEISTADVPVSPAGVEVSTASHDVSTTAAALVYIRRNEKLARKVQEKEQVKAMAEQEQERINFEAALELQRQLNEREEVLAEAT
ncbi:hypothetical protein Tco_0553186, partial [Tanacetum coccineum]